MKRRQVTTFLDEEMIQRLEKIREDTGLSIAAQINLKFKGYNLIKTSNSVR